MFSSKQSGNFFISVLNKKFLATHPHSCESMPPVSAWSTGKQLQYRKESPALIGQGCWWQALACQPDHILVGESSPLTCYLWTNSETLLQRDAEEPRGHLCLPMVPVTCFKGSWDCNKRKLGPANSSHPWPSHTHPNPDISMSPHSIG